MRQVLFLVALALIGSKALATGPLGPMYPVIEVDLLEVLTTHAREEKEHIGERYRQAQKRFESLIDRPQGKVLPVAQKDRTWRITPEIADRTPLAGFERHWLLIDGDDDRQIELAARFMKGNTVATHRVILTTGSVSRTQKTLKHRVWFDQNARLVEKLAIRALPCQVLMNGHGVLLKEIRQ